MRTSIHHQSEAQPPNGPLTAATSPDTPSTCPARQSSLHQLICERRSKRRGTAAFPCTQMGAARTPGDASISRRTSSIGRGEIPSSANHGVLCEATLSTCINSIWLRVTGGSGSISAIHASACQTANGIGTSLASMPAWLRRWPRARPP
jgi:hypothetical protein